MKAELKNCPFCGEPFEIIYSESAEGYIYFHDVGWDSMCPMEQGEREPEYCVAFEDEEDCIAWLNKREGANA